MATKKKELLEQDTPVTETVMSEDETLPADTAQPESLPADADVYKRQVLCSLPHIPIGRCSSGSFKSGT